MTDQIEALTKQIERLNDNIEKLLKQGATTPVVVHHTQWPQPPIGQPQTTWQQPWMTSGLSTTLTP